MRIIAILSIADLNPDILFVIAGQQYAPISHPDNVIFLGHQPYKKMPNFYNAMDVLCFLSVYSRESCPSVILESMACECPVIATNFSGTPELLGNCGEIVAIEHFSNEPLDISGYINPECVSLRLRELIKDEQKITHAGGAGVIPTGSGSPADSTRTSAEIMQTWYRQTPPDSTGSPPTNSDSQTEDTSESLWDTVKDWLGF